MKSFAVSLVAIALSLPAYASGPVMVPSENPVGETMDALEAAVGTAGATVFARVDHGGGAKSVGIDIPDAQLLVFGNPQLGTPAIQDDPRAGLFLPLKVLVFEDADGKVWLTYEDPEESFDDLDISDDAPYLAKMKGALSKLTAAAAGK